MQDLPEDFALIETMLCRRGKIPLLQEHLDRLQTSAGRMGIPYPALRLRTQLNSLLKGTSITPHCKIRITLNAAGMFSIVRSPLQAEPHAQRVVCLSPYRTSSSNVFYTVKSTVRERYETEYARVAKLGYYDVLFLNEQDQLTEGSRNNLFIQQDKKIFTPPLSAGALPGVFRMQLMRRCRTIIEKDLYLEDLCNSSDIYLTNAVRGIRRVIFEHIEQP